LILSKIRACQITDTLRLHYNAVLYNADRVIHNASCENCTPCVFLSQVWH